ncbi:MAG: BrnT family toxin [Verrucomicrobia bacterium]|nr:BrnT family toxin [Verrucomicrobiota bacterium]MBU4429449.1 BrnT family toxin [Verrucomicrobiota bacterium]
MTTEYPEFSGFDWDDGNRSKNLKHAVRNWECEQVFFNEPLVILGDPRHSVAEDRGAVFGHTDGGRKLVVIYTMRKRQIRVISARDMNRKERRFYENAAKDQINIQN